MLEFFRRSSKLRDAKQCVYGEETEVEVREDINNPKQLKNQYLHNIGRYSHFLAKYLQMRKRDRKLNFRYKLSQSTT